MSRAFQKLNERRRPSGQLQAKQRNQGSKMQRKVDEDAERAKNELLEYKRNLRAQRYQLEARGHHVDHTPGDRPIRQTALLD